ncbi:MAG: hypothetical protein ABIU63_03870 [Chitinophagaceae bacterium]
MKKEHKSCPSSTCKDGAILLGVVNENSTVGYISTPITIDEAFVKEANRQGNPEQNFRFSNTCVEGGCQQWQQGKCGVIKNIMGMNDELELEPQLPDCSIRISCRWFYQEGPKACSFCPYIITNLLEEVKVQATTTVNV